VADLPSKLDRLLEILEIIAVSEQISISKLAKMLKTKVGSIKLYLDYLEELGLIYRWKEGRRTLIKITAEVVAKVGDTMIAVVNGNTIIWRCPLKTACPYFQKGCTTVDKCPFLRAMAEIDDNAKKLVDYVSGKDGEDVEQHVSSKTLL